MTDTLFSLHLKNWIFSLLLAMPCGAREAVTYRLKFPNAVHHEAEVRAVFSGIRQPVFEVVMSQSSPGRYAIHEFAKNIYNLRASDEQGHLLQITRTSPSQWNVSGHRGTVVIDYTLYGDHVDGTYDGIDATHAHLNMPATLMWSRGFEHAPARVEIEVPTGSNWKVATQLIPKPDGSWWAANLNLLMDSPIEISAFTMPEFQVEAATFRLALHHKGTDVEARVYARMCEAVVLEEEGVFGGLPKYDGGTYTFLLDYLPYDSGDGMEHRDSTVITGPGNLKTSSPRMIGAVSHEFFHSWNVKRIRPKTLEPFDYERANMSGELWFAEGFTNYYGLLTLKRAEISTIDQFARGMGFAVNTVLNAPGRNVFNAVDMSRLAPFVDAATAIDVTNVSNTFISYYTYGQALALGIDLAIRERFPGKSLDDWMRAMWKRHGDIQNPYTLDDLQEELAAATGSAEFAADIFKRHIYGMAPMEYQKLLSRAGLLLRKTHAGQAWLGVPPNQLHVSDQEVEITANTLRDTPIYNAGLDKGDRILQWNGKALKTAEDIDTWLTSHKPGDHVRLKVSTRAGEKEVEVVLMENPNVEVIPFETAGQPVTEEIKTLRNAWLSSKALHPLPKLEPMP